MKLIKVRVSYESEILGTDIFWEGYPETEKETIANLPARAMALQTANDYKTRVCGMWKTEVIE